MPLLIQFTGAGGTGKTTTKDLFMESKIGKTFKTIPSSARAISEKWGLKTEDDQASLTTAEFLSFQSQITETFLTDIQALLDAGENVITERSMVDHLAYSNLKWSRRASELTEEETGDVIQFINTMDGWAMQSLPTVDILGFFPTGLFLPEKDEFRTTREIERESVDLLMRGLLWRFQQRIGGSTFPIATMSTLDPKTRGKHIIALAERVLEDKTEVPTPEDAGPAEDVDSVVN